MKRALSILALLMTISITGLALGQESEVQTRFYDFNEMLIDGEFMRPEGMFTRARDSARFERLLALRREFMGEITESAKEAAFQ